MIRKIMMMASVAIAILCSETHTLAQERRQVKLDKVVSEVGGSSILHSEVMEYAQTLTQERRQMGYTSDRDPKSEALEALL